MSEETKTKVAKKFLPEVVKEKTYEFELITDGKPVNYGIGASCVVIDPTISAPRQIRYVPGWDTIIVSDQPEIEERLMPHPDINFSQGKLYVKGTNKPLVQYLLLHDNLEGNEYSVTNRSVFKLVDKTDELNHIRESLNTKKQAIERASDAEFEEVLPYARVLGMDISKIAGEKESEYENRIRAKFMQVADASPTAFLKGFEDPAHKREYDIILAFDQNIITDSYRDNEVNWEPSHELIVKLPSSSVVTRKFLAKWTFTEEGAKFYASLKKQVKY